MKRLLLNIIAVAVTLPVFGSTPTLSPSVLKTDREIIDAICKLVEFPQAAIYSSLTDVVNFTLHIRNNNEVRAVHYDETYYWAFTDAIERAIDNLPPIELSRKKQGERECYDINMSIDFSTLCNPLFKFVYVGIEDMTPPRYDAKYGSYGLILELLSDDDRLELYNQGVKSLLVTLYVERDGSVQNVAISTLSGDTVAPYKYQPLNGRWTPMVVNGVPQRSIVYERYNIRGKTMALTVIYNPSDYHDYCYGDCDNSTIGCGGNRNRRRSCPTWYLPYEYVSYDYMSK